MIEAMLDQLGDFQAQADLLEIKKRELLDAVKVPDEVLAAQDEANRKRVAIDEDFQKRQKISRDYAQYLIDDLLKPELPPEYVTAMETYREDCEMILHKSDIDIQVDQVEVKREWAKIDAELQTKTADIYAQVAMRKIEIETEFSDKASGVLDNIAKLTAQIKQAVKDEGKTVKGKFYQAVYVKGRVTWLTDMLDGMIVAFPALAKARKEGEPSVTLRRI